MNSLASEHDDQTSVTRREVVVVVVAAWILALAMSWPLPARLATHVPYDLGDPVLTTWQTAWGGHALRSEARTFQANIFRPERDTLAFTDSLLGLAPFNIGGRGMRSALIRHGLLWIGAYVVALLGAYLLARELGARPGAAAVAGIAFAYAPFRLSQGGHLHVLWSGPAALAFFLLVRGYRRRRPGTIISGWLVAAWQVTISWTIGVPFSYGLAAVALGYSVMLIKRRERPPAAILTASVAGITVFLLAAAVMARPYLRVADRHPESRRGLGDVSLFSPPVAGLLAATEQSRTWAGVTRPFRDRVSYPPEHAVFPGLVVPILAFVGATWGAWGKRRRLALAAASITLVALALGAHVEGPGRFYPYRALLEFAPGFDSSRTPGRLMALAALPLGLLAAAGAERIAGHHRYSLLVLGLAVSIEGLGAPIPTAAVPEPPPGIETVSGRLQLHLPLNVGDPSQGLYMLWTTQAFPAMANGYSGFSPPRLERLAAQIGDFPDERSVRALRAYGVDVVIVHLDLVPGTRLHNVAGRPLPDGMRKRRSGRLLIFALD